MNENEELLDEVKIQNIKSKSYYENRVIVYLAAMFGGGLLYSQFLSIPRFNIVIDALLNMLIAIAVAIPIELFRKYLRNRKNKKKGISVVDDPLWFHILESAFSMIILYWLLIILAFVLLT